MRTYKKFCSSWLVLVLLTVLVSNFPFIMNHAHADNSAETSEIKFFEVFTTSRDPFETKDEFLQRRQDIVVDFDGFVSFSDLPIALGLQKDELESPQEFQEFRSLLYKKLVSGLEDNLEQERELIKFIDIQNTLQLKHNIKQVELQEVIIQFASKLVKAFNKSALSYQPGYQVGVAKLDKDGYDITTDRFPIYLSWEDWAEQWMRIYKGYIVASRDVARGIWEEGEIKPVYVTTKIIEDRLIFDKLILIAQGKEWNIPFFRETTTLYGHEGAVSSLSFSPNGQLLASGSTRDKTIRLWDVSTNTVRHNFIRKFLFRDYYAHAFSPDGQLLALNPSIELYDVTTGEKIRQMEDTWDVSSIAFSPNGRMLLGDSYGGGYIKTWDVETGEELDLLRWGSGPIAISRDGKLLAVGRGRIVVYDPTTGKQLHKLSHSRGMNNSTTSLVFSADSRLLASSGEDGTTQVWEMKTGELLHNLRGSCSSFSPDGSLIATGSYHAVQLWDVNTGRLVQELIGHNEPILSVAFHPNGKLIASGSADTTIKMWELSLLDKQGIQKFSHEPQIIPPNSQAIVEILRSGTHVPIILPDRFTIPDDEQIYPSVLTLNSSEYEMNLDFTPDCDGARPCNWGHIAGKETTSNIPIDTKNFSFDTDRMREIDLNFDIKGY